MSRTKIHLLILINQMNKMNQMNRINQINLMNQKTQHLNLLTNQFPCMMGLRNTICL